MIARALATYLEGQSSVTNLLSSTTSIRTGKEPQGRSTKFITIITSREDEDVQTSSSPGLIGTKEQTVEFICESDTDENARTLVWAVRDAINSAGRGNMASLVHIKSFYDLTIRQRVASQVGGKDRAFPAFIMQVTFMYTEL